MAKNQPYQVFDHRGTKWTPEEDALLIQRFKAGHKPAVLAELHGRSTGAIRSRLRKLLYEPLVHMYFIQLILLLKTRKPFDVKGFEFRK